MYYAWDTTIVYFCDRTSFKFNVIYIIQSRKSHCRESLSWNWHRSARRKFKTALANKSVLIYICNEWRTCIKRETRVCLRLNLAADVSINSRKAPLTSPGAYSTSPLPISPRDEQQAPRTTKIRNIIIIMQKKIRWYGGYVRVWHVAPTDVDRSSTSTCRRMYVCPCNRANILALDVLKFIFTTQLPLVTQKDRSQTILQHDFKVRVQKLPTIHTYIHTYLKQQIEL